MLKTWYFVIFDPTVQDSHFACYTQRLHFIEAHLLYPKNSWVTQKVGSKSDVYLVLILASHSHQVTYSMTCRGCNSQKYSDQKYSTHVYREKNCGACRKNCLNILPFYQSKRPVRKITFAGFIHIFGRPPCDVPIHWKHRPSLRGLDVVVPDFKLH